MALSPSMPLPSPPQAFYAPPPPPSPGPTAGMWYYVPPPPAPPSMPPAPYAHTLPQMMPPAPAAAGAVPAFHPLQPPPSPQAPLPYHAMPPTYMYPPAAPCESAGGQLMGGMMDLRVGAPAMFEAPARRGQGFPVGVRALSQPKTAEEARALLESDLLKDARGWEVEPGVVNVRLLLLKSRDMRRKLRAAMHHATRPRQLLNHNEAAKVQRRDHFAARLAAMERTARACGMLPPTHELALAQASVFREQGLAAAKVGVVANDADTPGDDETVAWSSAEFKNALLVAPHLAMTDDDAHAGLHPSAPTLNFTAAVEMVHGGTISAATTRAAIHAALYRKFVLSAAHDVLAAAENATADV